MDKRIYLLLGMVVLAVFGFVIQANAQQDGSPLVTSPGYQGSPVFSGKYVAYMDDRNYRSNPALLNPYQIQDRDLYVFNLATKQERLIGKLGQSFYNYDLDGNTLVWSTHLSKFVTNIRNLDTNSTQVIFNAQEAKISGNIVVYNKRTPSGAEFYAYDIITKKEIKLPNLPQSASVNISGKYVVWQEVPQSVGTGDIVLYTINSFDDLSKNTKEVVINGPFQALSFDISGNKIVFTNWVPNTTRPAIYVYNIITKEKKMISETINYKPVEPKISGDLIAWGKDGMVDVFLYDLVKNALTQVTFLDAQQGLPSIDGTKVVWVDCRNIQNNDLNTDIYYYDQARFLRGDVNNDGAFNIADSVYFNGWFNQGVYPAPTCKDTADLNDDGVIDYNDFPLFTQILFGGVTAKPPYPEVGPDPTFDELPCK